MRWKHDDEVSKVVEADKRLAVEELQHANGMLKHSTESLQSECLAMENSSRRGLQLLGERNQLQRELQVANDILADFSDRCAVKLMQSEDRVNDGWREHRSLLLAMMPKNERTVALV